MEDWGSGGEETPPVGGSFIAGLPASLLNPFSSSQAPRLLRASSALLLPPLFCRLLQLSSPVQLAPYLREQIKPTPLQWTLLQGLSLNLQGTTSLMSVSVLPLGSPLPLLTPSRTSRH